MSEQTVTGKPRLWVRVLSSIARMLWKLKMPKLSWLVADFRFWLHDKGFR